MAIRIGGDLQSVPLSKLRPDWQNPRFPPSAIDHFTDDRDVYAYIDKKFDAASVAESIARHGFFLSEPLIAISSDKGEFIILEGNRRLTALKALASPIIREHLTDVRWKEISPRDGNEVDENTEIPVLVATSREEVAPILGYRHVTGITPWDPYQQARYVSSLIDDEDVSLSAAEVAELIGRDVSEIRAFYRNYSIVEQARDMFKIEDTERITDEFGVWTRAMTSAGLREYMSAPPPRDVVEGDYPLPDTSGDKLEQTITWLFGKPRSEAEKEAGRQSSAGRVISDSRQLTRLGRVLANHDGQHALETGASLKDAERAMLKPATRFLDHLSSALSSLDSAKKMATPELVELGGESLNALRLALQDFAKIR